MAHALVENTLTMYDSIIELTLSMKDIWVHIIYTFVSYLGMSFIGVFGLAPPTHLIRNIGMTLIEPKLCLLETCTIATYYV